MFPPFPFPPRFYLCGTVSCNSCHNVQRQSEYAAGAHWVWPRRLVTTIHHQTPNYQLPSKPTPTWPKAQ